MILDRLENAAAYRLGEAWERGLACLRDLPPDCAEGRITLMDGEVFVLVSDYATRSAEDALLETHRRFADVQVVLAGRERIDWHPAAGLEVSVPYSAEKDAAFYRPPAAGAPGASLLLEPGLFAVFYPRDGHRPQIAVGARPERVRKAVLKIAVELLEA